MKRILKIAMPMVAAFSIISAAMGMTANATEDQISGEKFIPNPYPGSYMKLYYTRYANEYEAYGKTVNKTSSSRYGGVALYGYTTNLVQVGTQANSRILAASGNMNDWVSLEYDFGNTAYYIDISGTVYNSTTVNSGVLEWGQVRVDNYGNPSIIHPY